MSGADPLAGLLRRLTRRPRASRVTISYAPGRGRDADLLLPEGEGPFAVVVLIHGGYWRMPWSRSLMHALADDVVRRGFAAWNIEYRRLGAGGGWPSTFEDVAAAVDALADVSAPLDLTRVATVGHSAGGHLAAWSAARHQLPVGSPGASPRVRPAAMVSLAGVLDLVVAAELRLGGGAAIELLGGGPAEQLERYALASPAALLPLGVPQLLVHGDLDDTVPAALSAGYADLARDAGDAVELLELPDDDHFSVIDPATAGWEHAARWLATVLAPR